MSIANTVRSWWSRSKDACSSHLIERALAEKLERYGRMLNFQIDSRQKTARIEMLLKGEDQPITLVIEEYELVREGANLFVVLKKFSASRQWLDLLLHDLARGKRIPVPAAYAKWVEMLA
ncbi:MAG: hypothetical protein AB1813_13795 [Verrucomicrobiota bacterium]